MGVAMNIGEKERREGIEYFVRVAVRGIILDGSKVFILKNNKGDYKFPGGGVEVGESMSEALKREVEEETGFLLQEVGKEIVVTVERRPDAFKENCGFEMTSHYYLGQIENEFVGQKLDAYEADLEFEAEWMELSSVLAENIKLLEGNKDINPWVEREVMVMEYLLENHL